MRLRVTMSSKGVILLNAKAHAALNTPSAVTLHYDENERVIGLKPADPRNRHAFPLQQKEKGRYRVIYAAPFCRHFGITMPRTLLFNDIDLDNEGTMTLALRTATAITRGHW